MRLLGWIVMAAVAFAAIMFAVANRALVIVDFTPLDVRIELPLFAIILAAILLGFFAGAVFAWISAAPKRRRARAERRELQAARRELVQLRERAARLEADLARENVGRLMPPPADAA